MPFVPGGEVPPHVEYDRRAVLPPLRVGQVLEVEEGDEVRWTILEEEAGPEPESVDLSGVPVQGHDGPEGAAAYGERLYSETLADPQAYLSQLLTEICPDGQRVTVDRGGLVLHIEPQSHGQTLIVEESSHGSFTWVVGGHPWFFRVSDVNPTVDPTPDPTPLPEVNHKELTHVLMLLDSFTGRPSNQCGLELPEPPAGDVDPTRVPLIDDEMREIHAP